MRFQVAVAGRTLTVELHADSGAVSVDGATHQAELRRVPGSPMRILELDGALATLAMVETGAGGWLVQDGGERHEVEVLDERTAHIRSLAGAAATTAGPKALKAPMPGLVVRVVVEPGQAVAAGASLVVLEAMKMENDLKAPGPAQVDEVLAVAGQTVEKGTVLVTFRP